MKKILYLLVLSSVIISFTGCGDERKNETTTTNNQNEAETGYYSTLDDSQKSYMEKLGFTEESVNDISYEALNYYFIGTGMELYNKTSGVETNGVEYNYPNSVKQEDYGKYYSELESNNTTKITLTEAVKLRKKDAAMTLEDFLPYSFVKLEKEAGVTHFMFPIDGYDDLYVRVNVQENSDGKIKMYVPYIDYRKNIENEDSEGYTFSILYNMATLEAFLNDEPKYSLENKVIVNIHPDTITSTSVVVEIQNWTSEDLKLDESFSLYKLEDNEATKVSGFDAADEGEVKGKEFSVIPVHFFTDDSKLEPGDYSLVFGRNELGYVTKELRFTVGDK